MIHCPLGGSFVEQIRLVGSIIPFHVHLFGHHDSLFFRGVVMVSMNKWFRGRSNEENIIIAMQKEILLLRLERDHFEKMFLEANANEWRVRRALAEQILANEKQRREGPFFGQ